MSSCISITTSRTSRWSLSTACTRSPTASGFRRHRQQQQVHGHHHGHKFLAHAASVTLPWPRSGRPLGLTVTAMEGGFGVVCASLIVCGVCVLFCRRLKTSSCPWALTEWRSRRWTRRNHSVAASSCPSWDTLWGGMASVASSCSPSSLCHERRATSFSMIYCATLGRRGRAATTATAPPEVATDVEVATPAHILANNTDREDTMIVSQCV
jgi:hypothetical protein